MSPNGSVEQTGDNLTGEGDDDDESIDVDLAAVPGDVDKIGFPVSIYEADTRQKGFGQVRNAFIRIVNQANGAEITRYELVEDGSNEPAMVVGGIYRNGTDWKFRGGRPGLRLRADRHRQKLRRQR